MLVGYVRAVEIVAAIIAGAGLLVSLGLSIHATRRANKVQRTLDQIEISNLLGVAAREAVRAVGRGERLQFRDQIIGHGIKLQLQRFRDHPDLLPPDVSLDEVEKIQEHISAGHETLHATLAETREYEASLINLQENYTAGSPAPDDTVQQVNLLRTSTARLDVGMDGIEESLNAWESSLTDITP